jgi:hypothetical protein
MTVDHVRRDGPIEYFRQADINLFSAEEYGALF